MDILNQLSNQKLILLFAARYVMFAVTLFPLGLAGNQIIGCVRLVD